MILWKKGIHKLGEPFPEPTSRALNLLHDLVQNWYDLDLWVTSFYRPDDVDSLHSKGLAFDIRLPSWFSAFTAHHDKALHLEARRTLGPDYDVILEKDHIHVEYDPK